MEPQPLPLKRLLTVVGIFLAVAVAIAVTARDPGLTWDEAIYYGFAVRYVEWFRNLSAHSFDWAVIRNFWWVGQDHPPLGSLWIALNIGFFGRSTDLITAARLGAGILFAVTAVAIYLWVAGKRGARAGAFAAAVFVLMPRVFAHGHFANLEMANALLWLLTVIAFERGIERRGWSLACGVLFGLALLTKINAVFLPALLLPWGFLFHGRKALRNTVAMAVLGPLVFLGGWPVMWYHPLDALRGYLANKVSRMIIPVYYLGTVYRDRVAPWHYPFVLLLATTPLPVLVAAAGGLWKFGRTIRARWRESAFEALVIWAFLFPVLLLALPGIPKYDGIRLMLPAYPFLAALAAAGGVAGWDWALERMARREKSRRWRGADEGEKRRPRLGLALPGGILAAWLLLPVVALHPYQLCYYGELAGGPWGASRLGFETTYWDDTLDGKALAYLNEYVSPGGQVAFVAVGDFVWQYYQLLGDARPDIRMGEFERGDWDYLVVVPRQGWWTEGERAFVKSHEPAWVNTLPPAGHLPICMIYRKTED